jgi:hypothetical protein
MVTDARRRSLAHEEAYARAFNAARRIRDGDESPDVNGAEGTRESIVTRE